MAERKVIDWEAIEREFRAGQLSVREIGRLHDVSHAAINKKSKAEGWLRNLAERVRQEVSNRLVSEEVSKGNAKEAVDTAAARSIEVIRQHRSDISSARAVCGELVQELRQATDNRDDIEDAIEAETAGDQNPKRRAMMLKAVSLGARATVISNLSVAMKNLVGLERQAFSLNDASDDGDIDHSLTVRFVRAPKDT